MSVAIRAITRLQDGDDAPALGAGQDGYALTWDNASGAFVATALFTGGLLATGATTGATAQAQTFTNGIIGPTWKPVTDSTTALQLQNAAGTRVLAISTANYLAPRIYGDTDTPFIELSNAIGTTIAYGASCTLYLGGPIWYTTGGVTRMGIESDGSFWVGERVAAEAKAYIHQTGTTSAMPVLLVKQSDVSEEFIAFHGTSTTDASQSLVDATDMTTPGAVKGWLKIHVEDLASSGAITDGFYYVPFYSAPTA